MPAVIASAPGKIILFGEHAVVYARPAIAIPVHQVRAKATISATPTSQSGEVRIIAPDIQLDARLDDLPADQPLVLAVRGVVAHLGITRLPALTLRVSSSIPIAAGLGSGAAVSIAVIRALAAFLGHTLSNEQVSSLAFTVEQRLHGIPSGIDNTVITYAQPIYFQRGQPFQTLQASTPLTFIIADTGIHSPTAQTVMDVRTAWAAQPEVYEKLFDAVGQIARQARFALENGAPEELGNLMKENHALLQQIGVSCPELDHLVRTAHAAGAYGAKLSGGGRGGNMIALVSAENAETVMNVLLASGAKSAISTSLQPLEQD